jgi:hypothetical protein
MKTIFYLFSLICCTLSTNIHAQNSVKENEFEKKKNITQVYDLSSSDRVSINNKFGNIKINSWNDSKIKVEIEIVVNAKTEAKASQILDGITVNYGKEGGLVSFKTRIDSDKSGNNNSTVNHSDCESCDEDKKGKGYKYGNGNMGMKINYNVYMPTSNNIKLYNEFGNIALQDYSGAIDLHNKFGNLVAENITSTDNEIFIEFGNAEIKSISNPDLVVKFGNCDLASIKGNGSLKYEFCGDVNITLDKNVGDLKVKNSYSNIELTLNENTNATFDVKSSYGEVKNKNKNLLMKSDEDDEDEDKGCCNFTKNHKGTIGAGVAKVKIDNSYGKVKFR